MPFRVTAYPGGYQALQPIPATSVDGGADVATLMKNFATQGGWTFENNGVNVKVASPHLRRSLREQIVSLAQAAGIQFTIENNILAIWPSGQARSGAAVEISPATGLVGYPGFSGAGILLKTLWQPTLRIGGMVNVKSSLQPACGSWFIYKLDLSLQAQWLPQGDWFALIAASTVGVTPA